MNKAVPTATKKPNDNTAKYLSWLIQTKYFLKNDFIFSNGIFQTGFPFLHNITLDKIKNNTFKINTPTTEIAENKDKISIVKTTFANALSNK